MIESSMKKRYSKSKAKKAILERKGKARLDGKIIDVTERFDIFVLAVSGKYAMVRRPGCYPFVEEIKNILF